jgi:hypothetical protein
MPPLRQNRRYPLACRQPPISQHPGNLPMYKLLVFLLSSTLLATPALAANTIMIQGIPVDFILFALTLLGVALLDRKSVV